MFMKNRMQRQDIIRGLLRSRLVRTQSDLIRLLKEHGLDCTQSTISRDITELRLRKTKDGYYILPEDLFLRRMVSELVLEITAAQNLVVIKTTSGTAQGVAAALDAAKLDDIVGSIAGDDTIMLVALNNKAAVSIVRQIGTYQ
jgi:transcriptional regulator of arginine metabolism